MFVKESEPRGRPKDSVFNGLLQKFERTDSVEGGNLENFMRAQKSKNDSFVKEQLCHEPQNVQLCARLQPIKYHNDQLDNAEVVVIEKYSLMAPDYANGLTIAAYWAMVEKMMSVLMTFASMGG